jgi:hypothetical protein
VLSSFAVCVTGWYFNLAFYAQLYDSAPGDIYVVAHQPPSAIPGELERYVPRDRMLYRPNVGYDWGCYQQFLATGAWQQYDVVCFLHDDVEIKSPELFAACADRLATGCGVVGNGRPHAPKPWPRLAPHAYAHASWIPPATFMHDVVRGSFFAATRASLAKLGQFEVYWDPWHITSGFGNWSVIASCAKWEHCLGPGCFGYLSEQYLTSAYLVEHVRGEPNSLRPARLGRGKAQLVRLIELAARRYVELSWRDGPAYTVERRVLGHVLRWFSGGDATARRTQPSAAD